MVTAFVAVDALAPGERFDAVDLGCGLGSVLMLVAWAYPDCTVTGVEAQVARADRARRSLRYNGAAERCNVVDGDMRAAIELRHRLPAPVRLVTGTPPYFDPAATNLSHDEEAAACRAEIRGGLEVYLDAGRTLLAPGGHLVLCYPHFSGQRAIDAASERGLHLDFRLTVIPAVGKPPLIVVDRFIVLHHAPAVTTERELVVRTSDGQWTPEFRQVRSRFGMPDRTAS